MCLSTGYPAVAATDSCVDADMTIDVAAAGVDSALGVASAVLNVCKSCSLTSPLDMLLSRELLVLTFTDMLTSSSMFCLLSSNMLRTD